MIPEEFFAEALPYALESHASTAVLPSVILAQWAAETGYGGPDWSPRNNPGNVGDPAAGGQTTFPTLQQGVDAYIATMRLGYYAAVRAATTWQAQSYALGQSPWAAAHYVANGVEGGLLIEIIESYDLTRYDSGPPPPPKPPQPTEEYEEMDSVLLPDGTIVSHAVGTNNHYYEITRKAGTQGSPANTTNMEIIDITDAFNNFPLVSP